MINKIVKYNREDFTVLSQDGIDWKTVSVKPYTKDQFKFFKKPTQTTSPQLSLSDILSMLQNMNLTPEEASNLVNSLSIQNSSDNQITVNITNLGKSVFDSMENFSSKIFCSVKKGNEYVLDPIISWEVRYRNGKVQNNQGTYIEFFASDLADSENAIVRAVATVDGIDYSSNELELIKTVGGIFFDSDNNSDTTKFSIGMTTNNPIKVTKKAGTSNQYISDIIELFLYNVDTGLKIGKNDLTLTESVVYFFPEMNPAKSDSIYELSDLNGVPYFFKASFAKSDDNNRLRTRILFNQKPPSSFKIPVNIIGSVEPFIIQVADDEAVNTGSSGSNPVGSEGNTDVEDNGNIDGNTGRTSVPNTTNPTGTGNLVIQPDVDLTIDEILDFKNND